MMTVKEVSRLTGVSIRALQYYDRIGLLHPSGHSQAGYRLYDEADLEILQQILLFRELEFPLKDIRKIIRSPGFDRSKALDQQIGLLKLKKEHIENLIDLAVRTKEKEGTTPAYQEYEEKAKDRTKEETGDISRGLMDIFAEFGAIRNTDPASEAAQALVKKLQEYITKHYYTCTKEILSGLGKMYAAGGEFTGNIDSYGGEGTATFAHQAIEAYCR